MPTLLLQPGSGQTHMAVGHMVRAQGTRTPGSGFVRASPLGPETRAPADGRGNCYLVRYLLALGKHLRRAGVPEMKRDPVALYLESGRRSSAAKWTTWVQAWSQNVRSWCTLQQKKSGPFIVLVPEKAPEAQRVVAGRLAATLEAGNKKTPVDDELERAFAALVYAAYEFTRPAPTQHGISLALKLAVISIFPSERP